MIKEKDPIASAIFIEILRAVLATGNEDQIFEKFKSKRSRSVPLLVAIGHLVAVRLKEARIDLLVARCVNSGLELELPIAGDDSKKPALPVREKKTSKKGGRR